VKKPHKEKKERKKERKGMGVPPCESTKKKKKKRSFDASLREEYLI